MRYVAMGLIAGVAVFAVYYLWPRPLAPSPALPATLPTMSTLSISSPAFKDGGRIPAAYTCDDNKLLNPPLRFGGVPKGAKSLALIMHDPDVPRILRPDGVFNHWVVFNIPPGTSGVSEGGAIPGVMGANTAGASAYTGPCPPPRYEPRVHRYIFTLYALDAELPLGAGATKGEVLKALSPHVIDSATLVGRYSRE